MPELTKKQKIRAWLIGGGIALIPIHNVWLTNLTTLPNGQTWFFLPALGMGVWVIVTLMFLVDNWQTMKDAEWGRWQWTAPLLIIAGAIALSGIGVAGDIAAKLTPFLLSLVLVATYLVSRVVGREILKPLIIGSVVAAVGVILRGLLVPGQLTGGFVFEQNYDVVLGYILLGTALYIGKWRWLSAALAVAAVFFAGSPEGVFVAAVLLVVVLWRRDWSNKVLRVAIPVLLVVVAWFVAGYGQQLYSYMTAQMVGNGVSLIQDPNQINNAAGMTGFGDRITKLQRAYDNFQPFGIGYTIASFNKDTVHNVPLIIVQQLGIPGIIAGVAWLWLVVYGITKTKWKYVWVLIPALSVFDHFVWTQLAPWFWVIAGVTSTVVIKDDLVFRNKKLEEVQS